MPISLQYLLKGQMAFMKQNGFEVTAISSNGTEINDIISTEGCTHYVIPFTRKITPILDLWCLLKLVKLLIKIKPHVVHSHTPKAGIIGMLASFICRVPIRFHTIAGAPWFVEKGLKKALLKTIEKITIFCSTKTFVNSFSLLESLNTENILSNKLSVIGNGTSNGINCNYYSSTNIIQSEIFKLKQEAKANLTTYIWIFIGRLVKDKGVEELISAFCKLVNTYPDNQLWLIGEEEPHLDPLSDECKRAIQYHQKVKHWGFRQDVRPFLAASNTLVFPSYREGFPNVPMQASLMGCNLILSNINGCNEIVQHLKTGLLVKPENQDDLFEKMEFAYQNDKLMLEYAKHAKDDIIRKYNQIDVWKNILCEYNKMLK